jgi:glucose-1-phosphate cytidylyltransferase
MQVVVFCGGQGTRISGSGPEKKELYEIGTRPILWHVMKIFAAHGHTEFVLPLGHRGDLIRRYFLEYEQMTRDLCLRLGGPGSAVCMGDSDESNWKVTLVDTGLTTSTGQEITKGERIRRIASYLDGDRFFLTYGDGVADIDIDALLRFHRSHGRWVTVTGYQPAYNFGIVDVDQGGQVTAYHQYPQMKHWINAGFFMVERAALGELEAGMDWETGFLVRMVQQGQLMLYRHVGFWRKMDTLKEAVQLNQIWASGNAPWKVW